MMVQDALFIPLLSEAEVGNDMRMQSFSGFAWAVIACSRMKNFG